MLTYFRHSDKRTQQVQRDFNMKSYVYQTVQEKNKQPLNVKEVRISERQRVPTFSTRDVLICFLVLQYRTFFNLEELRGTLTILLLFLEYLIYLHFIFLDFSKYLHLKDKHFQQRFFDIKRPQIVQNFSTLVDE